MIKGAKIRARDPWRSNSRMRSASGTRCQWRMRAEEIGFLFDAPELSQWRTVLTANLTSYAFTLGPASPRMWRTLERRVFFRELYDWCSST